MNVTQYLLLAASLPALGFLLLVFWGRRMGRFAGVVATALVFGAFALSAGALILFVSKWVDKPGGGSATPAYMEASTYHWIELPAAPAPAPLPAAAARGAALEDVAVDVAHGAVTAGLLVDSLTVALFLLITFLATIVHFYSLGFLGWKAGRGWRFYGLANFLLLAMLGLILANSLIQFFIFWQLVGVGTYLLTHLESERRGPVIASLRGFIYNRIGDVAFIAGIGILARHVGTGGTASLAFFDAQGSSVLSAVISGVLGVRPSEFLMFTGPGPRTWLGMHWLTWTCICFLVAALVRSGQFPFFAWLEDSAEGPIPFAALAQTCITVASAALLVARLYPIFTMDARLIMAVLGCVSLTLAAMVACVQTDLRRLLAWSTASQLGYVLLFLGAGGYVAGLLHLFTHAFFKAGLILAAGSVLQAMQGQSDLRQLGGLWKRMPITAGTSLVMVLALACTPWLSGAYSANIGLARVYDYAAAIRGIPVGAPLAWHIAKEPEMLLVWIPILATYLTAFGIGRWWWLIFVSPAQNPKMLEEAHEYPLGTLALIILAGFSVGFWFDFFGILQFINRSLAAGTPVVPAPADARGDAAFVAIAPLTGLAVAGVIAAILLYFNGPAFAERARRFPGLSVVVFWLRERLFLETGLEWASLKIVFGCSRLLMLVDRYALAASFRILAFGTEALAHLVLRMDALLDRPVKTAALLLAPRLRHLRPAPPVEKQSLP